MATFKISDCSAILTDLFRIVTKQDPPKAIDSTNFVDCGTLLLEQGYHNILEGLSVLVGETYYNARKYNGKWKLASKSEDGFAERFRKVYFYNREADESAFLNTDINPDNFYDGANPSTGAGSMWDDMKVPMVVEQYFYNSDTWQEHITIFEKQLQDAFRSQEEFLKFVNAYMTAFYNEVEVREEQANKMAFLNRIAGNYLLKGKIPESAVNLRHVYKDWTGKNYTTTELWQDHLLDLLKTFTSKVQLDSDKLTNLSKLYHDPLTKTVDGVTYSILQHTPKDKQKFIFYSPIWRLAKNFNYAELFNTTMIPEINGEGVTYWVTPGTDVFDESMAVDWKPSLPANLEVDPVAVHIPMVLGLLFDDDAIANRQTVSEEHATPLEARKLYYQVWMSRRMRNINSYIDNSILYYLEDEYEEFKGDGVTTEFDLDAEKIVGITVDGVAVDAEDYTFEDGTITFDTAPADGKAIVVQYI